MSDPRKNPPELDSIEEAAAAWVLRLDAGLTTAEEAEFAEWLGADPRHETCFAEYQRGWARFAPLAESLRATGAAPDADRLAANRPQAFPAPRETRQLTRFLVYRWGLPALAAVATVAVGVFLWWPRQEAAVPTVDLLAALTAPCEQRELEDGSTIVLARGAAVKVAYTPTERRVWLEHGEAYFTVTKNPPRPFIVGAAGVEVRAVGTAFNMRLDQTAVQVIVTEGKVQVNPPASATGRGAGRSQPAILQAGQSTTVQLATVAPTMQVATLSAAELGARLAWQPRLLDYDDATLAEIVAEFNRRNPVRLAVDDPILRSLRLTASFRSDNVQGFVRLLESNYGVRADRQGETEIVLRRK